MTLFQEKYAGSPGKIQGVVSSENASEVLADIALKNRIGDDGLGNPNLGRLVGHVLVGLLHPKDFVPSLEKELGVSGETARNIAKEVNEKIFSQVKDELIVMYNLDTMVTKIEKPGSSALKTTKDTYNTPSDLLDKKLQQTVISQEKIKETKNEVSIEKPVPPKQDSYREIVE